jgi:hypothetical protein
VIKGRGEERRGEERRKGEGEEGKWYSTMLEKNLKK